MLFLAAYLNGLSLELCVAGLGMYETPLFLAHEEESGGRSVPTTPLQVAAPGKRQRFAERSRGRFPMVCAALLLLRGGCPELPAPCQGSVGRPWGCVCSPVTVFTESASADASEHASQSVPMVTTSTGSLSTTTEPGAGDDADEVFAEAESEG